MMNGLLFVPAGVSAETPVPAIVVSHGMYNNREMQDANFVELSRRGFVVLSMNMLSHGSSENVENIGIVTTGMYEAVKMLTTLNYVNTDKIGITGHSLGGMSSNVAAALDNAAEKQLISAILLNNADATYKDAETGEYINAYGNRDTGIVAAQYDEFFMSDVDENENVTAQRDYLQYKNAQSFLYFGTDPSGKELRQAETMYAQNIEGEEAVRVIYNPAIIHPWSHFSQQSTKAAIEFFDKTLNAPLPLASTNQIWQIKEAFNLLGLIGFAIFVVNFTILMVFTPFFSVLKAEAPVQPRPFTGNGKAWFWGSISLAALFGTVVYLPILQGVKAFTTFADPVGQSSPWGVSCWAAACGLFAILMITIILHRNGKKDGINLVERGVKMPISKLAKTVLLAVIVVAVSYAFVFFADYFFKADFRIWVLAVKAFDSSKLFIALFPYMVFFLIYYIANSVAVNSFNYNTLGIKEGKGAWVNTAVLALFNSLPAIILVALQYSRFFSTGFLLFKNNMNNMFIVWLFPIIVILAAAAVISRKIYRATNNPYLPGIINGVIITLIACSNTLTWA